MKKLSKKIIVSALMLPLFMGLSGVRQTNAYYDDLENSLDNIFSATFLDLVLTNNSLDKVIGPEALGEVSHASVVIPEEGSLPMQYILSNNIVSQDGDFCSELIVEAKLNGVSKYSGSFSGLAYATTTEFGTWEFRFDLPPNASVADGAKCHINALFSAWRQDVVNPLDSGWHDEEILDFNFTARMVVLNEIFARPNSGVAPKDKEYIELYNNGDTPVDTLGWQISEIAGTTETFYSIVASSATSSQMMPYNGASTIIPAGGFLVLQFGGSASHLNDTGDTVKLYDTTTTLLDAHTYPAVAAGKAVVRFPDGIGFWVDPEPTPGTTNIISLEDLQMAGFTDEMITEVLQLAEFKNITLLEESAEIEETSMGGGDGNVDTEISTEENVVNTDVVEETPTENTIEIIIENIPPVIVPEIAIEILENIEKLITPKPIEESAPESELIELEPATEPTPELSAETLEVTPATVAEPVIIPEPAPVADVSSSPQVE